jgi:pimeloyl-ACP methyl ester carboxylesterase
MDRMAVDRIIMFPGLGADPRLLAPQQAGGLPIESPEWIMPGRGDDLPAYARRICDALRPEGDFAIGGVSFGGMVACELAQLCKPKFLLLISSCRSARSLPRFYQCVEWVSRLVPGPVIKRRCEASSRFMARVEGLDHDQYLLIRDMSMGLPVPFLRRVGRMIPKWEGPASFPCPVHHIHGARDRVIPMSRVAPDEVVEEGGHLINMTHPQRVNRFIERVMHGAPPSP